MLEQALSHRGAGSLSTVFVLTRILVDLLNLNVAPLAVFQMLKSMCAGQRLASDAQDPAAMSLPTTSVPETRGQSWAPCSQPRVAGVAGHSVSLVLEWPGL